MSAMPLVAHIAVDYPTYRLYLPILVSPQEISSCATMRPRAHSLLKHSLPGIRQVREHALE